MDSRPSEDQAAFAERGRSVEGLALWLPSLSDPVSVAHRPRSTATCSVGLRPGSPRSRWCWSLDIAGLVSTDRVGGLESADEPRPSGPAGGGETVLRLGTTAFVESPGATTFGAPKFSVANRSSIFPGRPWCSFRLCGEVIASESSSALQSPVSSTRPTRRAPTDRQSSPGSDRTARPAPLSTGPERTRPEKR